MGQPFRYYLRVRYIECDAQKVVFNSRDSEYVDVSINEFLRAIGVLQDFIDGELDFQLVKQTVEWKGPARFDQVLELSIAATRLGNTSFTIRTEFRIAGNGNVIVTAETVCVLVDGNEASLEPPSDDERSVRESSLLGFSDAEWARWPAGPYLVFSREDGALLGSTGLLFETRYRAGTGYVLAKDAWGRGYATEALGAMVGIARAAGVRRLYALCHAEHRASARVLEKSGFSLEGMLRGHSEFPNLAPIEPRDVLCFAALL